MDEVQPQLEWREGHGEEERLPLCRGAVRPASLYDEELQAEGCKGQVRKTGQPDSWSGEQEQHSSSVEGQLQQEGVELVEHGSRLEGQQGGGELAWQGSMVEVQLQQGTGEQVQLGSRVEVKRQKEEGEQLQQSSRVEGQQGAGEQVQQGSRVEGQLQQGAGEQVQQGAGGQVQQGAGGQVQQGAGEQVQQGAGEQVQQRTGEQVQLCTGEQVQQGLEMEVQLQQEGGEQVQHGLEMKRLLHLESEVEGRVVQNKFLMTEEKQEQKLGLEEQRHPSVGEGYEKEPKVEKQLYAAIKGALEQEARKRQQNTLGTGEGGQEKSLHWTKDQDDTLRERTGSKNESSHVTYLLTSDNIPEVKELEDTIEELLMRLDEFCCMTDMVRNETSQLLDEDIHAINAKVKEMNKVYAKVDKLEAFVKMVGRHVTCLEEQLVQAERDHQPFPNIVHKILQSANIPSFIYKHSTKQQPYKLPELYRTEDYIPLDFMATKHRKT